MQITHELANGRMTLKLNGRFDFHSHRTFREAYEKALLEDGVRELEINLNGVDYLDSSALGMLLLLREKTAAGGRQVALSGLQGTVKQVLDVANFSKLFAIR